MATTSVLFVHRRDAKLLKSRLEKETLLDKRFRMITSSSDASVLPKNGSHHDCESNPAKEDSGVFVDEITSGKCIAVPVTEECIDRFRTYIKNDCKLSNISDENSWERYAVASGRQLCPFSTSTLGNQNHAIASRLTQQKFDGIVLSKSSNLTNIKCVVVKTLVDFLVESVKNFEILIDQEELAFQAKMVEASVLSLCVKACPQKLEVIGDDRTLVVPGTAFLINDDDTTQQFHQLLTNVCTRRDDNSSVTTNHTMYEIQKMLWKNLASLYKSTRVVRRGDIDSESAVRESGHRILWPLPASITSSNSVNESRCTNHGYIPQSTGPGSPGWITVTEHKIKQSFDLTRVMFSRGNVTEKKRFGLMVQPDDVVLDMYAGIGYYTLPALVHGHAKHVTACEWNPNAVYALRYNLIANQVDHRAVVLEGDCRLTLRTLATNQNDQKYCYFDRISLGLLPSSEGGWPVAVACLNREKGGWLHIHGNVPTVERQQWAHWLCRSLVCISKKNEYSSDWHAICVHTERVKSFAPKVDHLVADFFVGPLDSPHLSNYRLEDVNTTGVFHSGVFTATPLDIPPPSCALGSEGVLHQEWMMAKK